MLTRFDCRGMIPILPKSTFTTFSPIVFLRCPAGDQLHRPGNRLPVFRKRYDQVDMIGGDDEIENG